MRAPSPITLASLALLLLAEPSPAQTWPGRSYFGTGGYIEYVAGNLPIVLSAPHGGNLKPSLIPDRSYGVRVKDSRTQELARRLVIAIRKQTGGHPHLIINHLHRIKLDANREIVEAAQGNKIAEQAWKDYHAFIDQAKASAVAWYGRGHYYDIHGHAHPDDWVELGYLLTSTDLGRSNATLNSAHYVNKSSLRTLASKPGAKLAELVRGAKSLGALLALRSYRSVPSPADPSPGTRPYFSGGYNTRRHGSRSGGTIDGTQLEHPWPIRMLPETRSAYGKALAESLDLFFRSHYAIRLGSAARALVHASDAYASERGEEAAFTFSRTGGFGKPMSVGFTVGGTATEGQDFVPLPRSITIPALAMTSTLRVQPRNDSLVEGSETILIRLTGTTEVGSLHAASVLLADDEQGRPTLEADWALDEIQGGLCRDSSGKGHHATVLPSARSGPRLVQGVHGFALAFDELDDRLSVKNFSYAPAGSFTLSFWFRAPPSTQRGFQYIFSHGPFGRPSSLNIYLVEASGMLRTHLVFQNALVDNGVLDVAKTSMDGRWHQYVLVARPGQTKDGEALAQVFIDGLIQAEGFFAGDRFQPRGNLSFGARQDLSSSRYFGGSLDAIELWSRALSPHEVEDLYRYRPGSLVAIGKGCRGTGGTPSLALDAPPEVGRRVLFQVKGGPSSRPGFFLLGASRNNWHTIPLPLDLGIFGAPGCSLYVSFDLSSVFTTTRSGTAAIPWIVPFEPSLVRKQLFDQCLFVDPSANALGLTVSNGLGLRFGGIR